MFFKKDGRCISSMSLVNLVFSSNHTSVCHNYSSTHSVFFSICLGLLRSLTSAVYLRILRHIQKVSEGRFLFTFLINDLADVFTFADLPRILRLRKKCCLELTALLKDSLFKSSAYISH